MYPDIIPRLRVEETISNPFDPAEVFGFIGRNRMLGRTAIIMKEAALTSDTAGENVAVEVPEEQADILAEGAELVVLTDERVYAMDGADFAVEARSPTVHRGGQMAEMKDVNLSHDSFETFHRRLVEISN